MTRTLVKRFPTTFDEAFAPFDKFINHAMQETFPAIMKDFGHTFFTEGSYPKVNVTDYSDKVLVEAAVPGLDKDKISIEVLDGVLTISGQKAEETSEENKGEPIRREIKRSFFSRTFYLGEELEESGIEASHKDGLLTLTIPKKKPEPPPEPKKIELK